LINRRNNGAILGRHMKFANVVWCDGHVKATRLETLGETRVAGGPMFRFTVEED
jgi:prepilin-type processing-associated H-X9-DG protein